MSTVVSNPAPSIAAVKEFFGLNDRCEPASGCSGPLSGRNTCSAKKHRALLQLGGVDCPDCGWHAHSSGPEPVKIKTTAAPQGPIKKRAPPDNFGLPIFSKARTRLTASMVASQPGLAASLGPLAELYLVYAANGIEAFRAALPREMCTDDVWLLIACVEWVAIHYGRKHGLQYDDRGTGKTRLARSERGYETKIIVGHALEKSDGQTDLGLPESGWEALAADAQQIIQAAGTAARSKARHEVFGKEYAEDFSLARLDNRDSRRAAGIVGGPGRPAPQDLTGQEFGSLTVVRRVSPDAARRPRVEVRCTCGHLKMVRVDNLMSGRTKTCRSCSGTGKLAKKIS